MNLEFKKEDIVKISNTLGCEPVSDEHSWVWNVMDETGKLKLIVTLYYNVDLQDGKGAMVSVQSVHGYFELHDITTFVVFEPDEVIFIRYNDDKISTLVVGREATCSLYSDISRNLLKNDLSELEPAVLLSAMQIAIIDSIIE